MVKVLTRRGATWKHVKSAIAITLVVGLSLLALIPMHLIIGTSAPVILLCVLSASWLVWSSLYGRPLRIDILYGRVFFEHLLKRPQLLSVLRPAGIDWFDSHMDDFSVEGSLGECARVRNELAFVRSFDQNQFKGQESLSREVFEFFLADLESCEMSDKFVFHHYIVNQLFGAQSEVREFLVNKHTFERPEHAPCYVKRVRALKAAMKQLLGQLRQRDKAGIVPPRFMIQRCIDDVKSFVATPAEHNLLYIVFATKTAPTTAIGKLLGDAAQARLLADVKTSLELEVYPAFQALLAYLEHLLPSLVTDHGVWRLPDGEEYYRRCLRHHTTTDMTPQEIHNMGLDQVGQLQTELRAILSDRLGLPGADFRAVVFKLAEDPENLYTVPPSGADEKEGSEAHEARFDQVRAQIIKDYSSIIADADSKMDRIFNVKPTAKCVVERIPVFKEKGAPGAYYWPPALDGSSPGTFYANLRDISETPKFKMRTLAYHEAVPGHHFQISIAQGLKTLPFFRRMIPYTAYIEGWGLYAEHLCAEEGFQEDPLDRIGYIDAQLMRAVRLVVDTGVHHFRWTREAAIRYMVDNTLMKESEVITEIERYIVMPGQACAYMVGLLKLLQLREKAKKKLGAAFNLAAFHDVVLLSGPLPLVTLEKVVDEWLAK